MKRGTIVSRTNSGPFLARYVPAAPAASSASGTSASRAASQPPDAIEVRNDPPLDEWPSASPFRDACDFPFELRALRTAIAAAPVAAAAAAAFTAVFAPLPLPVLVWLVVSFSFSVIWTPDRQLA